MIGKKPVQQCLVIQLPPTLAFCPALAWQDVVVFHQWGICMAFCPALAWQDVVVSH
jgi:hypothetical protein